jgi:predicted amidohydrolase
MGRHPDAVATTLFVGGLVILSFPMAWLFERSGRSAWVALAAHAGVNSVIVGHGDSWRATIVHLAVFSLAALAAARALKARSRGYGATVPQP